MSADATLLADLLGRALYGGAIMLIAIGIYAVVARYNLMRVLLGLVLVESGVNLFIVAIGYRADAAAPIIVGGVTDVAMVDPLPQALVLTAIVIGVGVLALASALLIRVKETFGTLDTREVARVLAADPAAAGKSTGSAVAPAAARETANAGSAS
ncbi:MAG: sodium:proton antiporter [Hyphomicrobiales bacterium]